MLPDTEASAGQAVRAAIAAEGADTERPTPVYFGEGPATAASAENSARFLAWRWDCGQSRAAVGVALAPTPVRPRRSI